MFLPFSTARCRSIPETARIYRIDNAREAHELDASRRWWCQIWVAPTESTGAESVGARAAGAVRFGRSEVLRDRTRRWLR